MAAVNKVILVGNCGRDPEVRYLPDGSAVCNTSVATTSRRKDKNSGEIIEDTQWHRLTFFNRLAEIAGEYLAKGDPVYVEGRIKYGTYVDKTTGVEKSTCEIVVSEMQLLGTRKTSSGSHAPDRSRDRREAPPGGRAQAPAPRAPSGFDDMDDDIPF